MGSIQVRYEKDTSGRMTRGPYAYYIQAVKRADGTWGRKSKYIGKVPHWYILLLSRDSIAIAKGQKE